MGWDKFLEYVLYSGLGAVAAFIFVITIRDLASRSGMAGRHNVTVSMTVVLCIIAISAGAVASALASALLRPWTPAHLGPSERLVDEIQWPYVWAFVSMLVGMASSYFNRLISERRAKIDELRKRGEPAKPGIDFDVWDFVQPFFVSLITFGVVIGKTNDIVNWTNILVGFQTGFFWQTILAGRTPSR